jgi:hypothetical protein
MIKLNNLERLSDGLHGGRKSLFSVVLLAIMLCVPAISHATISSVSLVLSQNGKTAEIPMVADLFRSQNDQYPGSNWASHTSDVNRWQLGIKWDNKEVVAKNIDLSADFDWCFKVTDGTTSYYGPSSNETAFDGTALGSNGRVSFGDQKVSSSSSPVYFKTTGGAKSYTFSYANDSYRSLQNRSTIGYSTNGYPSAQIWKNTTAITEVPATTTDYISLSRSKHCLLPKYGQLGECLCLCMDGQRFFRNEICGKLAGNRNDEPWRRLLFIYIYGNS